MARAGLGSEWTCLFANDIHVKKGQSYAQNWGADALKLIDVSKLTPTDVPGKADLAWASFPCQDLSLAGNGAGLSGKRSGTFWPFWKLIEQLAEEGRSPSAIVLENVCGALTSHGGSDFSAIAESLARAGYRFGAVIIDAAHFVPQSRPRLFIVCIRQDRYIPSNLIARQPITEWHPSNLVGAYSKLSESTKANWLWWTLPLPPQREKNFIDLLEAEPAGVRWHTIEETARLLSMMNTANRKKVDQAKASRFPMVGGVYRRTRPDTDGKRKQRAEVRFDGIAGCLRTPGGGSSRQSVLIVNGDHIRSRLLSPREAARLMGLPETYQLPCNYNDAYHLVGDGLAVPVVRFLSTNLLEPLLAEATKVGREVA